MRAVTGSVVASKPVSLSKASAILYRFAAEAVARSDVAAFLRRASAGFDDLVSFHRDLRAQLRGPHTDGEEEEKKEKKKKRRRRSELEAEVEQMGDGEVVGGEEAEDAERESKKRKKKKWDGDSGEKDGPERKEKKQQQKRSRRSREREEVGEECRWLKQNLEGSKFTRLFKHNRTCCIIERKELLVECERQDIVLDS